MNNNQIIENPFVITIDGSYFISVSKNVMSCRTLDGFLIHRTQWIPKLADNPEWARMFRTKSHAEQVKKTLGCRFGSSKNIELTQLNGVFKHKVSLQKSA